jgi:hypothetical protein
LGILHADSKKFILDSLAPITSFGKIYVPDRAPIQAIVVLSAGPDWRFACANCYS